MADKKHAAPKNAFYSEDDDSNEEEHPLVNLQKEMPQMATIDKAEAADSDIKVSEEQVSEVEEDPAEFERREAQVKLQKQMIEQQVVVVEHQKKLKQLEKVLAEKKQEEDELGKNFFGAVSSISSVGTQAVSASAKEYSSDELERL